MQFWLGVYIALGLVWWMYLCVINPHLTRRELFLRGMLWLPLILSYFVSGAVIGLGYSLMSYLYHNTGRHKSNKNDTDVPKLGTNR